MLDIFSQIEELACRDNLNEFDNEGRGEGIVGVKVPPEICEQQYCTYACVESGCKGFAFFCRNLACSCKDPHSDHIHDPESWRTIEELNQALSGPPAIQKASIFGEWRAMDLIIEGLVKQVEKLQKDHEEAKNNFLEGHAKHADIIPLIKAQDFSLP